MARWRGRGLSAPAVEERVEPRISMITLGVRDLARARQFYQEGLGWPLSSMSQDDVAFFRLRGTALALYPRDLLAADANLPADADTPASAPAGARFGGITLAHNVPERALVDEVLARATAAGATILKPAADAFWGGYHGYFTDPDGYAWEIAWGPMFEFSPEGHLLLPE